MNLTAFLEADDVVDWRQPEVQSLARMLGNAWSCRQDIVRACFEFVRDEIRHSVDHHCGPVTCAASEVLRHRTGYCYAKSHLLAALLRANGIPAALCYQRLRLDGPDTPFCLHGLNAVWLENHGWFRLDARGNKTGVDARFEPPQEMLAFPLIHPGECDLPGFFSQPLAVVVEALRREPSWQSLLTHLPDIEPSSFRHLAK